MPQYTGFLSSPKDFRTAMHTVLTAFFDGNQHYLGDAQYTFPVCKVLVTHRLVEPPTGLTIAVIGDSAIEDEERYKISDPDDSSKRAIEVRGKIQRSLFVVVPGDSLAEGKNRKTIDTVWGLIYGLFCTQPTQFSEYGIFTPTIPILPTDIQVNPLYLEAFGTLKAEVRSYFRPYSSGV